MVCAPWVAVVVLVRHRETADRMIATMDSALEEDTSECHHDQLQVVGVVSMEFKASSAFVRDMSEELMALVENAFLRRSKRWPSNSGARGVVWGQGAWMVHRDSFRVNARSEGVITCESVCAKQPCGTLRIVRPDLVDTVEVEEGHVTLASPPCDE